MVCLMVVLVFFRSMVEGIGAGVKACYQLSPRVVRLYAEYARFSEQLVAGLPASLAPEGLCICSRSPYRCGFPLNITFSGRTWPF